MPSYCFFGADDYKMALEDTNTRIRSAEDRIIAIEAELGITSMAVVGNTNHAQYEELKTRHSTLQTLECHLHGQVMNLMARQEREEQQLIASPPVKRQRGRFPLLSVHDRMLHVDELCSDRSQSRLSLSIGPPQKMPKNSSSQSVSAAAVKDSALSTSQHHEYPPYLHWLGLKLYDIYLQQSEQSVEQPTIACTVEGFERYKLERSRLLSCSDMIKEIIRVPTNTQALQTVGITSAPDLCRRESTYTSLYAVALDRLLFGGGDTEGVCVHQFPSRIRIKGNATTTEHMDIAVLQYPTLPPVLVSDLKTVGREDVSMRETTLYGVNVGAVQNSATWPISIGMSGTPDKHSLLLYIPVERCFWRSTIIRACLPHDMGFLFTLYVGVSYLLENPILLDHPLKHFVPEKDVGYQMVCPQKERVLRVDKKVHKFFDTQDECERRPNHTLLEKTGVLRGVAVRKLSSDQRFTCLERDYIEGAALEVSASAAAAVLQISHFSGALSALQSVHGAGYIHGDVRFANIIYDGKDTHLIDYELARERTASPRYPLTYSSRFPERHRAARPNNPMEVSHDVYSMRYIMVTNFPRRRSDLERCETVSELMDL